jgi:hypothetical protein
VITILDTKLHAVREELHRAPHTSEVATLTGELQRLQSHWADFDRYSTAVRAATVGVEAVPGIGPKGRRGVQRLRGAGRGYRAPTPRS